MKRAADLSIRVSQILMILTVLLLFSMGAQPPSSPAADDTGVIQGTVVDPAGKPVADATVYAVAMKDKDRPMGGRWPENPTQSDDKGNFALTHVTPDDNEVYAFKYSDYYEDYGGLFYFNYPKDLKVLHVEVKPGQTVTGVVVRLPQKVGMIHLYVRDADTKELVHGADYDLRLMGFPKTRNMGSGWVGGSGPAEFSRLISLGVEISIKIAADDGKHERWEYRNPKTGSRYFKATSGETETMNIYLRKKK